MDGKALDLEDLLSRPLAPPDPAVIAAIEEGPIAPDRALALEDVARLLDPRPLEVETGWCTLPDGVVFVAVRTAMPAVSGEMVDWWFDWHPRDPLRYRVWHPMAHRSNSLDPPTSDAEPAADPRETAGSRGRGGSGAKAHWGAVHHPVEDVGVGVVRARIAFQRPSAMGLPGDQLENPDVATIVCGYVGDDRRRMRHTAMYHVFLRDGDGGGGGVVLRSAFWLGAAIRPYGPLGTVGERLLNNRFTRRATLPAGLPRALARHCAEEYANLATLLPELFERFGQGAAPVG
jgi:phloretin hydrolase